MKLIKNYLILFCAVLMSSCSTKETINNLPEKQKVNYSIVYIINGDGDYLYHDKQGSKHFADEDKLREAISVAKQCRNGEVFIFHQKEKSGFLFFHSDDGDFYHFINGNLIVRQSYDRSSSPEMLEAERGLYKNYRSAGEYIKKYFLYFGHEIPEIKTKSYFQSYPDRNFDIQKFTEAVKDFAEGERFELLVLSTCHNGTPGVISELSPYSKFIIASPEDLHLSYIDTEYLNTLDKTEETGWQFAKNFARQAYQTLEERTSTVISIVVYNTERTHNFLNQIKKNYSSLVYSLRQEDSSVFKYIDLNEKPSFFSEDASAGVKVFYRPPLFGINKQKSSHSGWEIIESE